MRKRGGTVRLSATAIRFITTIQAKEMMAGRRRPTPAEIIQKLLPKNWERYYRMEY